MKIRGIIIAGFLVLAVAMSSCVGYADYGRRPRPYYTPRPYVRVVPPPVFIRPQPYYCPPPRYYGRGYNRGRGNAYGRRRW
jgi:hypothetical protein